MSDIDPSTRESQSRLLESLASESFLSSMPQPKIRDRSRKIPTLNRAGRGTFEDHKRLLRYYICPCGTSVGENFSHSTVASHNGTAVDKYSTTCDNCGDDQEVSFMSLRSTLQEIQREEIKSDRTLFPYI